MSIYRIEIEVDGDPYAETDWQAYAVNCMFEAFGTRKVEHIAGPDGIDLTLDNSDMIGHVRMTGPHDDTAPAQTACTAEQIASRIHDIATIIRDGSERIQEDEITSRIHDTATIIRDGAERIQELADLLDVALGVQR